MWTIWQDSPAFGCDDNPGFKWYARRSSEGHTVESIGPFATEDETKRATGLRLYECACKCRREGAIGILAETRRPRVWARDDCGARQEAIRAIYREGGLDSVRVDIVTQID